VPSPSLASSYPPTHKTRANALSRVHRNQPFRNNNNNNNNPGVLRRRRRPQNRSFFSRKIAVVQRKVLRSSRSPLSMLRQPVPTIARTVPLLLLAAAAAAAAFLIAATAVTNPIDSTAAVFVSAFVASPPGTAGATPSPSIRRRRTSSATTAGTLLFASSGGSAALIVQNKGGGHGELGYQLALHLLEKRRDLVSSITILQDDACEDDAEEPFKSYAADFPANDSTTNVRVVKAPLSSSSSSSEEFTTERLKSLLGGGGDDTKFEYVWDNCSKNAHEGSVGKALCDLCAGNEWNAKLLCYVSSAGMYKWDHGRPMPMPESTPVKESAGQAQYERYASSDELKLPFVAFRPQYIYGPKSNKFDYIDWYFDRIVRGLPLPIPSPGTQKVSLTNSRDVASILASPLDDVDAATRQRVFNCGTDRLYSYDDVAYLCADAAGVARDQVRIEHYDADTYGKAKFPFRMTNFYVEPDAVKNVLGWKGPEHDLKDDLKWYYEGYKARGGPDKQLSLVKDWEIVVGSKTTLPEQIGSVYDKYDPLVFDATTAAAAQN